MWTILMSMSVCDVVLWQLYLGVCGCMWTCVGFLVCMMNCSQILGKEAGQHRWTCVCAPSSGTHSTQPYRSYAEIL